MTTEQLCLAINFPRGLSAQPPYTSQDPRLPQTLGIGGRSALSVLSRCHPLYSSANIAVYVSICWQDQGQCGNAQQPLSSLHGALDLCATGSCWAFSAVAAMEGAVNLKANGTVPKGCVDKCGPNNTPCCSFSEQVRRLRPNLSCTTPAVKHLLTPVPMHWPRRHPDHLLPTPSQSDPPCLPHRQSNYQRTSSVASSALVSAVSVLPVVSLIGS